MSKLSTYQKASKTVRRLTGIRYIYVPLADAPEPDAIPARGKRRDFVSDRGRV